ncbi:MAG TPA: SDR family NAD(P)-dependent oxidoreductase, partial [Solirubrobacterales bacterium]|nr:SDR family NAD(P)-dependent oxidoreductase [Solirubrobacterales bacterium]
MKIEGAGALISGGASGLGEATARSLAAAGARVVIADRDAERGKDLAAELGAEFLPVDVTEPDAGAAAVDRAAAAPGGLRISVCCAGIGWAE